jgi:predicted DNA-binding protein YlxM (UPF0122 family)
MSWQTPQREQSTDLAEDYSRGRSADDLAVKQQEIEEYIRKVEAEFEWHRRRLRVTRSLRRELHHMRKLLEIRRVKMIVGSLAIVLAAAIVAGATGRGPLAPLLARQQPRTFVQRRVPEQTPPPTLPRQAPKQPPRPILLRDRAPAVSLGPCTNYMSAKGYHKWLRQSGSQPACP